MGTKAQSFKIDPRKVEDLLLNSHLDQLPIGKCYDSTSSVLVDNNKGKKETITVRTIACRKNKDSVNVRMQAIEDGQTLEFMSTDARIRSIRKTDKI